MSLCSKRTTSSIDIVDRNCSISNEVKDEIRRKLSEMKSFIQIGREENTSISTVMRIFHDIEVPHRELDYETVYLDEFKGNADKEKYQLYKPYPYRYFKEQEIINHKGIPSLS